MDMKWHPIVNGDLSVRRCEELYSCGLCRCIFAFWLDEELVEDENNGSN